MQEGFVKCTSKPIGSKTRKIFELTDEDKGVIVTSTEEFGFHEIKILRLYENFICYLFIILTLKLYF